MNTSEIQALKAKAHHLKPIILIGARGLSDAVIAETDQALTAHELIKVKMKGLERDDRKITAEKLAEALKADIIQMIGNMAVIYRKNPEE